MGRLLVLVLLRKVISILTGVYEGAFRRIDFSECSSGRKQLYFANLIVTEKSHFYIVYFLLSRIIFFRIMRLKLQIFVG